jgi:DNA-binding beta-propeller fold protein YncE
MARTKWLLWSGENIDAATDLEWGVVVEVLPHDKVLARGVAPPEHQLPGMLRKQVAQGTTTGEAVASHMTQVLVTSASGANGDGYGAILCFSAGGRLIGPLSQDLGITDPRGLVLDQPGELVYVNSGDDRVLALDRHGEVALETGRIDGLDAGGATFGPDGRYYVGLRRRRTILALPPRLDRAGEPVLPDGIVPFPRGFGFGPDGDLYLASGVGPSGEGENTIAVFDQRGGLLTPRFVDDPELSPLDLVLAPNGNIVVSSEWPFGAKNATTSVREYHHSTGGLARVFVPDPVVGFARPRGLRFGSDERLYCVGQDHVVAFDFSTGSYLGVALRLPRLNGQALVLWDRDGSSCEIDSR